jgi:RHS repeat-associated protein
LIAKFCKNSALKTSNEITFYFYNTKANLIGFNRNDVRSFVGSDLLGSPRVILNEAGTAVKKINYSAFGEIIENTNPSFEIPVGYAGGIADSATKLVRFGFRDYEPSSGRWTARDPILFEGGQGNLYVYVGNNPVMYKDSNGLWYIYGAKTSSAGLGVGVQSKVGAYYGTKKTCGTEAGGFASVAATAGIQAGVSEGLEVGFNTGNVESLDGRSYTADLGFPIPFTNGKVSASISYDPSSGAIGGSLGIGVSRGLPYSVAGGIAYSTRMRKAKP